MWVLYCLSVHKGACVQERHVWWGGMHGRGCVHGGEYAWQGACVVGGMAGGHAWQGECAWQGACVAGETATAAGGKHPT